MSLATIIEINTSFYNQLLKIKDNKSDVDQLLDLFVDYSKKFNS